VALATDSERGKVKQTTLIEATLTETAMIA